MDNMFEVKEIAAKFNVKEITVYKWIKRGKIDCIKKYGRILFTEEHIKDFLNNKRNGKYS